MADLVGNRYTLEGPLGQGGMSSVFKALDTKLGRFVALKIVANTQQDHRQALAREAKILGQLSHPRIASIYDHFEDRNNSCIVMELVDGTALCAVHRGRPQNQDFVLKCAHEILGILQYLHSQTPPIICRDLNPKNLLVTKAGLKMIDFGISKVMEAGKLTATVATGRGTPGYAPLEQYSTKQGVTDQRSDFYALGATLYFLLTGQDPPEAVERAQSGTSLDYTTGCDANSAMRALVDELMRLDKCKRPTSINAIRSKIQSVAPSRATIASQPPRHSPGPTSGGALPMWVRVSLVTAGSLLMIVVLAEARHNSVRQEVKPATSAVSEPSVEPTTAKVTGAVNSSERPNAGRTSSERFVTRCADGSDWYVDPSRIVAIEPGRAYTVIVRKHWYTDEAKRDSSLTIHMESDGRYRFEFDSLWYPVRSEAEVRLVSPLHRSMNKCHRELFDFVFGKSGWHDASPTVVNGKPDKSEPVAKEVARTQTSVFQSLPNYEEIESNWGRFETSLTKALKTRDFAKFQTLVASDFPADWFRAPTPKDWLLNPDPKQVDFCVARLEANKFYDFITPDGSMLRAAGTGAHRDPYFVVENATAKWVFKGFLGD